MAKGIDGLGLKEETRGRGERILDLIDCINDRVGSVFCHVTTLIAILIVLSILMRFAGSSAAWPTEVSSQLFVALFMLAGGYALLHKIHVNVDVVHGLFSPKKRLVLDLVSSVFFFIYAGIMLWQGTEMALVSVARNEYSSTAFVAPLYPIKIVIAIGALLLLLQGLANFIRNIIHLKKADI